MLAAGYNERWSHEGGNAQIKTGCAGRAAFCARKALTWSGKRSTGICWLITRWPR